MKQPTIQTLIIAACDTDIVKPWNPCFVSLLVTVTKEEYLVGLQFEKASVALVKMGYDSADDFVNNVIFTEEECPQWLMNAFLRGHINGCTPAEYKKAKIAREKLFKEEISRIQKNSVSIKRSQEKSKK